MKNYKKCVVCGTEFYAPPSSKKITCSKFCSTIRKTQTHMGKQRPEEVREKLSVAKTGKRPQSYDKCLAANKASPKTSRGVMNSAAKKWGIRYIETGEKYFFTNLVDFIRNHPNLFDIEPTPKNVDRIRAGFTTIKRNMIAKRSGVTYKGWELIYWDDRPNYKRGYI